MAEYVGSDLHVAVQVRMRERHDWISDTPEVANGGRVLNFLDPEGLGWDKVQELTREDRVASFVAVPLDSMMDTLHKTFGPDWETPYWNVFFGDAKPTLAASNSIISSVPIPPGWCVESFETPTDDCISEIQKLNISSGIAPYPAYYSKSEAVPCLSTCFWDEHGTMVATASANYRYHPKSRFSQHLFAGSVSVSPNHQRKGLGKLANAVVLVESHKAFGWVTALEQARPDNIPSRCMIEACGLKMSKDWVTISVVNSEGEFTR